MIERSLIWKDEEYTELDPEIRDLVKALHTLNISTVMSCEGHIRESSLLVGVYPWPWVIILDKTEKLHRLQEKLNSWNKENPTDHWFFSTERIHGSYTPHYIQTVLLRGRTDLAVRALTPKETNPTFSPDVLLILQQQARSLAEFISPIGIEQ